MDTPIRLSDGEDVEEAEDDEKDDGQILPPTLCWLHGTFGLATDGTDAKTGGSLMYKYVIDQKGCKAEIPERASCRSSQVDSLHHRSPLGLARP